LVKGIVIVLMHWHKTIRTVIFIKQIIKLTQRKYCTHEKEIYTFWYCW